MLVVKEFNQIRWMVSASKYLQFLSKDTGISSEPAAAEGFVSSIASIMVIQANTAGVIAGP